MQRLQAQTMPVVEGVAHQELIQSAGQISVIGIEDALGVAGAHAVSGLAGGVSSLHHAGAASAQNGIGSCHHHLGQFHVGVINALEHVCGAALFLDGLLQKFTGVSGGDFCTGMRSKDTDVGALQSIDAVDQNGHVGVGGGNDAGDDALGMSDIGHMQLFIVADDALGLLALDGIPYASGGAAVLCDFKGNCAQAGLLHCFTSQVFALLDEFLQTILADFVDLFLRELLQLCQSFSAVSNQQINRCLVVHSLVVNDHNFFLL